MESKPVSEAKPKRQGWFSRLSLGKKIGVGLAAVFLLMLFVALVLPVFSRSREAARIAYERPATGAGLYAGSGPLQALPEMPTGGPVEGGGTAPSVPATSLETWGRQLILSASMRMEVEDVRAAYDRIMFAAAQGGLISSATLESAPPAKDEKPGKTRYARAALVLRVPQARFQAARQRLLGVVEELGGRLVQDQVSSEDVTEQHVDLKARQRHFRSQEAQLLEIMRRATKIADIIAVRDQLSQVQEEIERITAQLRFLENRVDLSTITVEVYAKGKAPAKPGIISVWKDIGKGIAAAWMKALGDVVRVLGGLAIAITYVAPFALIAVLVWLGVRKARGGRARRTGDAG